MRTRKQKKFAKREQDRREKQKARTADNHFMRIKTVMADRAHPAFRDHILAMNKTEFKEFLEIFDNHKNITDEGEGTDGSNGRDETGGLEEDR